MWLRVFLAVGLFLSPFVHLAVPSSLLSLSGCSNPEVLVNVLVSCGECFFVLADSYSVKHVLPMKIRGAVLHKSGKDPACSGHIFPSVLPLGRISQRTDSSSHPGA